MAARIALHRGAGLVIGVDLVSDRLYRASVRGVKTLDLREYGKNLGDAVRDLTDGRGTDAVIDAVGMEAHGASVAKAGQWAVGMLPDAAARPLMERAGIDRLSALHAAIDLVRRGGTVSVSGVYGGAVDPMPLLKMFDKQIQLRMGQANVRNWVAGHSAAARRRGPARRGRLRHPPPAAGRRAQGVRDLPEEGGRHGEDAAQAVTAPRVERPAGGRRTGQEKR